MDKYHKEFYEEMKYKTKDWQFKNWFVFANLMGACAEIETKHFGRIDGKDVVWLMERILEIMEKDCDNCKYYCDGGDGEFICTYYNKICKHHEADNCKEWEMETHITPYLTMMYG